MSKKVRFQDSPKNLNFPKGLVHAFRQQNELFLLCVFFGKSSKKISFTDILNRKQRFLKQKKSLNKVNK